MHKDLENITRILCEKRLEFIQNLMVECVRRGPGFVVVVPELTFRTDREPNGTWSEPFVATEEEAKGVRSAYVYTQRAMSTHQRLSLLASHNTKGTSHDVQKV